MTVERKILKKFTDHFGDEITVYEPDDSKVQYSSIKHDPYKYYSHFGGNKFDHTHFGSWEEYLLNRHSPLGDYRTISEHLQIEWDRIYPCLLVSGLLKEDYPVKSKKFSKPTFDEIKTAVGSAAKFVDGKTGEQRNDELLQSIILYAVGIILSTDKKHKSDALNYIQKSKDIWSKYRKQ